MKTWYRAVCDSCRAMCHVLVNGNHRSIHGEYLDTETVSQFLATHYGCELRLVWRDDQLDADDGKIWEYDGSDGAARRRKRTGVPERGRNTQRFTSMREFWAHYPPPCPECMRGMEEATGDDLDDGQLNEGTRYRCTKCRLVKCMKLSREIEHIVSLVRDALSWSKPIAEQQLFVVGRALQKAGEGASVGEVKAMLKNGGMCTMPPEARERPGRVYLLVGSPEPRYDETDGEWRWFIPLTGVEVAMYAKVEPLPDPEWTEG